ncbi:hypothetical protein IQ255_29830 [Pleurocapsales cyanobacterium LEGE 10410]|nr:hypothetical protein [Pleurocapsales cyanobacterium LEGE 10410]
MTAEGGQRRRRVASPLGHRRSIYPRMTERDAEFSSAYPIEVLGTAV